MSENDVQMLLVAVGVVLLLALVCCICIAVTVISFVRINSRFDRQMLTDVKDLDAEFRKSEHILDFPVREGKKDDVS